MKLKLVVNDYLGVFYRQNTRGFWRRFAQVGNAGVALQFADMLRKLDIEVEVVEEREKVA
jgi:hypothetical protein